MTNPTEDALVRTRKAGALSRPLTPSAELAAIVGDEPLARTEIVKRVWDYIKANGCQDPADKREIVADDKLRAVFGQDRVNMMKMMGLLSPHLKAI
jgi:DNA topoisomerase-3